eukprot:2981116-Lingulodinium_polyedra.AAC.1
MHCQADYVAAQYVIKELARELQKPTEASMKRLKHLIRYLIGAVELWTTYVLQGGDDVLGISVGANWAGGRSRKSTDM